MKTRSRIRPQVELMEGRTLLSAGALDTSFGGTGMVTTAIQNSALSLAVAVQPDLKVVVAGDSQKSGSLEHTTIARYNGDGSLDTSFGTGGIATVPLSTTLGDSAYAVAIQPADGKIVVAGWDSVPASKKGGWVDDWSIIRLNSNGSLDNSFGGGKGYVLTGFGAPASSGQNVFSLALQPDGKIVAAGPAVVNGSGGVALVRYNTDGSLDSYFGTGGVVVASGMIPSTLPGQMVAIDSSGRFDVVGYATVGSTDEMAVERYLANGTRDTSFGSGGLVEILPASATSAVARSVGFQSTGKLVVYGLGSYPSPSHAYTPTLVRLNTDGSLDSSFGSGGFYAESRMQHGYWMVIQPDDKIVAVGNGRVNGTLDGNFWVTRVLADGSSYDSSFGTSGLAEANFNNGSFNDTVACALAPDGKIVVTGHVDTKVFATARFLGDSSSPSTSIGTAARSSTLGSPDSTFLPIVVDESLFIDPVTSGKRHRTTSR